MAWLIHLRGESMDLEELPKRFDAGPIHVVGKNGSTILTGAHFDQSDDAAAVVRDAEEFLLQAKAIVSLEWPAMKLPTIGAVQREVDGKINQYVLLQGVEARGKIGEISVGGGSNNTPANRSQRVLDAAESSPSLRAALGLWGRPDKTWSDLYRITEELQTYLGKGLPKAGLCSQKDLDRLTQSAQNHDVAGLDARHGVGRVPLPKDPMTLEEAKDFVGRLLRSALQSSLP